MTEYTTSMTKDAFQRFYRTLSQDTSLMRTLVGMQSGVTERKAYETAEAIIRDVAAFEGTLECWREDTMAVIDSFLQESPVLQGENRMEQLHRLHFGLKVHADAGLVEALKEGTGKTALFEQYYAAASQDSTITEETLTEAIRQQLASLAVSPELMTAIAHKLEEADGVLANAASVSADAQRFQCILAMQLYTDKRDEGMTTAEAAALACSATETMNVADAAGRGLLTQEQVAQFLCIIGGVILLVGFVARFGFVTSAVGALVSAAAGTALAANAGNIFFAGCLVALVSDALGALAGRLAASYHFTHASEYAEMVAGFRRMGDALKEKVNGLKEKAADALRTVRSADTELVQDDEDTESAYAF